VFWERARDTAATVTLLFPAQLQLLLKLSNDGAETVDNDLRMVITHVYDADFAERFDLEIGTVWGCTESGACGAGSEIGYRGERGEGYVGLPLGTEDLRIHDAAGDELPTGETGEVWLRHQHVMIEYLADPVETDKVLIDGWVRTGDYGALDEEGRLFYRGRLKNMVKRSGENISPEEVEATLLEHPDIVECVVFGVPDPLRTEELSAHIVVTESFAGDPASLSIFVGESLARWKAPRYVRLYQEPFPRLASGKIDQVSVKEDFSPELSWDGEAGGLTSGRA
jgi:acyl-CoA synthetase (AMP-forming)/AMP-acid ligase II